jgi:ferredoxin
MSAGLEQLGVHQTRIKQEKFGTPPAIKAPSADELSPGAVEFVRSGMRCEIPPAITLLEVAEKNGITIPYSCRQGQCGTCPTRLLEGIVRMDKRRKD